MSIPSNLPKGQQITSQDNLALSNKPSVKGLASLIARSLPQQPTPHTNALPVNVPKVDLDSLPPSINSQDDYPLPPDYLPPVFIEEKTNEKALDIISKPIVNLPSIVITSPKPSSNPVNQPIIHSNKVIKNSPVMGGYVFDHKALNRIETLKDRADLGMTLPAVSKELNAEIAALAKKQGFTYDPHAKLYVKGDLAKTWTDFEAEYLKESITAKDESCAQKLESELELERKLLEETKEKEELEGLALVLQLLEEEEKAEEARKKQLEKDEAFAKQLETKSAIAKPPQAKPDLDRVDSMLSDDCVQELLDSGWTVDFDGQFCIGPNGEFLVFSDLKAKFI